MALVTVDQLVAYMSDVSLTTSQRTVAAPLVIAGVQAELEAYLNRPVQPTLIREVLPSTRDGDIFVSATPIHRVLGASPTHEPDGGAYLWDPVGPPLVHQELYGYIPELENTAALDESGNFTVTTVRRTDARPTAFKINVSGSGWYVVDYVGGYSGQYNAGLILAILRVCSREMSARHDDTRSVKRDYSRDEPVNELLIGWTEAELKRWERLRRRVVAR